MDTNIVTAVGVWFYCTKTKRYLYLMRNDPKHPCTWGLAGGKSEDGENLIDTIHRECKEELGLDFMNTKFLPLEKFTSADNIFVFHTFLCLVNLEFVPKLNDEHLGYAWINRGTWPRPMHPGLWNTVNIEEIQAKISLMEIDLQSTNYYMDNASFA